MKSISRSTAAVIGLTLAAAALTGCSEEAGGADSGAEAGGCAPEDVVLVGQVRNESTRCEAAWRDGGDAFAEQVGLSRDRLTYDGDSTKQQEQSTQLLAGETECLVMSIR